MIPPLRLATWNVEWFNALFDDADVLLDDGGWSGRWGVTRAEQIAAIGTVFASLDADAVMVIEAPDTSRHRNTVTALTGFADRFGLRTRAVLTGFANDTQQEIALLYDPDRVTAVHAPLDSPLAPRFDGSFAVDLDNDARPDTVRWSKPPLEVTLTAPGHGSLSLIGVHAKSKAAHVEGPPDRLRQVHIANRRKQLAQCVWLRARVDQLLAQHRPLLVMGDFNDGPGLDAFEALFGRSGVDIVLGEDGAVPLFDPHARLAMAGPSAAMPATARFRHDDRYLSALLDYIMVSSDLAARQPHWTIWHPFDTRACYDDPALRSALLHASDHFPVVIDLPPPLATPGGGPTS